MSKLLDELSIELTGNRHYQSPKFCQVTVEEKELESVGFGYLYEYRVGVNIGVTTKCTKLEKEAVFKNIHRELLHQMYKDFIEHILDAKQALYEEDYRMVDKFLNQILSMTEGKNV